jgi:hypothetical protein
MPCRAGNIFRPALIEKDHKRFPVLCRNNLVAKQIIKKGSK